MLNKETPNLLGHRPVTVGNLPPGTLFRTLDGIEALKTEYHTFDNSSRPDCYLLASGEAATFADNTPVWTILQVAPLSSGPTIQYHKWLKGPDTIKIKLERGQKGTYAWELTAEGEFLPQVLLRLQAADTALREMYPTPPEPEKKGEK